MTLERLRREILGALLEAPAFTLNLTDLGESLAERRRAASGDQLRQALVWLQGAGCVAVGTHARRPIATLTEAGRDVWRDVAQVPGIARPEIGSDILAHSTAAAADILKS